MSRMVWKLKIRNMAYEIMNKYGPKKRREIGDQIVDDLLAPYDVPEDVKNVLKNLDNLGWQLQGLIADQMVSNDSNCLDANEGMVAPAGTYFVLRGAA